MAINPLYPSIDLCVLVLTTTMACQFLITHSRTAKQMPPKFLSPLKKLVLTLEDTKNSKKLLFYIFASKFWPYQLSINYLVSNLLWPSGGASAHRRGFDSLSITFHDDQNGCEQSLSVANASRGLKHLPSY